MTKKEFTSMISGFIKAKSDHETILDHLVGVSGPTVKRWSSGKTHPHRLMRKEVQKTLKEHTCSEECDSN